MRFILLLLMVVFSGSAHAAWFEFNGFSVGTSYRPVTGTTITTSATITVSSAVIASSDTSIVRVVCDQATAYSHVPLLSTISIATPTTTKIVADAPEYFTLPANNAVAFRAYGTAGSCNAERMGK